jgi:2-enoate reductase
MDERLEPLFTPWSIGNVTMKNRIVMTSMGGTNIFGWMERNHFDREGAKFLMERARNDVGLILPGCQPVYNPIGGQWLDHNRHMYEELKPFMEELHATGAKMFVQLTAGFGRSFTVSDTMEQLYTNPLLRALSRPFLDLDKICATASASPNRWSDKVPSREMTVGEIDRLVEAFATCSKLLRDAGVDGVEVHAVHEGYLLDQFTLPYVNHRTDEYGGSRENRYRFPVRIVRAIHEACGDDFPVSLRYSVTSRTKGMRQGALSGEEYVEVGRDMDESEWAARYLQDSGYAMLNCDNGTYDAWYWAHPPIYMPENCNLEDVEHIKGFVDVPVVCAGRMDPYVGARAVAEGRIDAVGFARPFLADGEWVTKLEQGREQDVRPCICCHNGCFNMAHYRGHANAQSLHDSLHLSRCAVNAETMQTGVHRIVPAKSPKRVAVIGGGIGGMECARVLKLRGHEPVVYERADQLGGVFRAASRASFKGKLRDLLAWYEHQMDELGIEVRLGQEVTDLSSIEADEYVVATGSSPRHLPVPGIERTVEAIDFLDGAEVGQTVAVIGGGLTGCEIAYELCLQGKSPIIVEMKDDLVAQDGVCLANSSYLREYFAWKGVPVMLNTTLREVADGSILVSHEGGGEERVACDSVVVSAGYVPNPLARPSGHVHLVGDCDRVGNLRTVIWRAYEVAMHV